MDKLDFLASQDAPPAAPEPAPEPTQERGPDGRFVSTDSPPEPVVEPVAEPVAPPPVAEPPAMQPGFVPQAALQEERAKRQALEEQLRRQTVQVPDTPDIFSDPEAFAAHQRAMVQAATLDVKLDLSEDMARSKYGDETVNATLEWATSKFAASPAYQQEVLSQRNPYEFAVREFKREQTLRELSETDLDEFKQWKASKNAPLSPPPPQPSVQPPPQSLASAPNAGGAAHTPTGPGRAYDGLFRK